MTTQSIQRKNLWGIYRKDDGDLCEKIFESRKKARQYLESMAINLYRAWPHKTTNVMKMFEALMKGYKVVRLNIKIVV